MKERNEKEVSFLFCKLIDVISLRSNNEASVQNVCARIQEQTELLSDVTNPDYLTATNSDIKPDVI